MHVYHHLLAVVAVVLPGCTQTAYELELTPKEDSVHRKLAVHRTTTGEESQRSVAAKDELAVLARVYRTDVLAPQDDRHLFEGDFAEKMPADIGGAGWHGQLKSPMGATRCYVERFRGSDDLAANLERRLAAADRLADLLAEYVRAQAGDEACDRQLQSFVEGPLQRDIRNLVLYMWAVDIAGHYEDEAAAEFLVRIGQYLIERDYFAPADIPQWLRVAERMHESGFQPLLNLLQRTVARKIGVPHDQPVPNCISRLLDEEQLRAAFPKFMAQTPEYQQLIAQSEQQRGSQSEQTKSEPHDVLEKLLSEAFLPGFSLFQADDSLTVTLRLAREPIISNGQWDPDTSTVRWTERLPVRSSQQPDWPNMLYTVWSEPNVDYQAQHFGKTVLAGDALRDFCVWYAQLSPEQMIYWDRFVSGLKPGTALVEQIQQFRFPDEPAAEKAGSSAKSGADAVKSLLLQALRDES